MRWAELSVTDRVPLQQDPEFAEKFLGPLPEYDPADVVVRDFYWLMRGGTPAEQPVAMDRALAFYERIWGPPTDAHEFIARINAMDRAYGAQAAKRKPKKAEKPKRGG